MLGAVIPILLTSSPGTAAGHGPSTGSSLDGAVAARDFTVQLPTNAEANGLAFSPDGKLLAIGAENIGATYLWDVATAKQAAILQGARQQQHYQRGIQPGRQTPGQRQR